MVKHLTDKDIEDGKRISMIFRDLSEIDKIRAETYLSALRDKELTDSGKVLREA